MPVQPMVCLRCRREIEAGHKSVAVYMFAQTVGVKPRQKSNAQRICFCPQCAVSLAMGMPPEGALNMAAWDMIRDLVSSDQEGTRIRRARFGIAERVKGDDYAADIRERQDLLHTDSGDGRGTLSRILSTGVRVENSATWRWSYSF
jgi:hypothetical protein